MTADNEFRFSGGVANAWGHSDNLNNLAFSIGNAYESDMCFSNMAVPDELVADIFKPERIIFNDRSTICFYKDGTKLVTTASENEPFIKEFGVAMNIIKKIYGTRLAFLRDVKSGYDPIEEKEKREALKIKRKLEREEKKNKKEGTKTNFSPEPE